MNETNIGYISVCASLFWIFTANFLKHPLCSPWYWRAKLVLVRLSKYGFSKVMVGFTKTPRVAIL